MTKNVTAAQRNADVKGQRAAQGTSAPPNARDTSKKEVAKKIARGSDESSIIVTVIKLLVILAILIGGTGLALQYVDKKQEQANMHDPSKSGILNWGISKDSPIHALH